MGSTLIYHRRSPLTHTAAPNAAVSMLAHAVLPLGTRSWGRSQGRALVPTGEWRRDDPRSEDLNPPASRAVTPPALAARPDPPTSLPLSISSIKRHAREYNFFPVHTKPPYNRITRRTPPSHPAAHHALALQPPSRPHTVQRPLLQRIKRTHNSRDNSHSYAQPGIKRAHARTSSQNNIQAYRLFSFT